MKPYVEPCLETIRVEGMDILSSSKPAIDLPEDLL